MCRRQGVRPCRVGTSYVEDRIMTVVCGLLQVVGKGKMVDHASLMKAITTIAIPTSREHWHVNNLTPTCHCQAASAPRPLLAHPRMHSHTDSTAQYSRE